MIALLGSTNCCIGQVASVSGKILDSNSKRGVPFANICIKNSSIGTVSNEAGAFVLKLVNVNANDTLSVSYVGYRTEYIALNTINRDIVVLLESVGVLVDEVTIRPHLPTYYIKEAIKKLTLNYPDKPFSSKAYYRELVKENDKFLAYSEGIFESYYADYLDTLANQHQLLLYREKENIEQMDFMRKQSDKHKEKARKKADKEGEEFSEDAHDLVLMQFGGPSEILTMGVTNNLEFFLDSNYFKKIDYEFGRSTMYDGRELMVISYAFKKYLDGYKMSGKLFLDAESSAVVAYDYIGDIKIPIALESLLFMAGIDIGTVLFSGLARYQNIDDIWYPENFQFYLKAEVEKTHWFSEDERFNYKIEQVYKVNEVDLVTARPIKKEKLLNTRKPLKDQVYNDYNLDWKDMNVVR
ncbi:MAG: carboxypeptidase-like regulatory domain-containing protein [Flavobacteriales bacterium]|nr:carboxypeptidase-like regulatory domain-containing protein [Flavobacteriales bacterium]